MIYSLRDGLLTLQYDVTVSDNLELSLDADIIFLTNTCQDKREEAAFLKAKGRDYYLLTFHEDFLTYIPGCLGFCHFVQGVINGDVGLEVSPTIEYLEENPSVVNYYGYKPKLAGLQNGQVLQEALMAFPSSKFEEATILRDAPRCNTEVVLAPSGLANEWIDEPTNSFIEEFRLPTGYMIQVGRLEPRKNQLATVLATRNIDLPLVFVATAGGPTWYHNLVANAAIKWRKYPTIIISQTLKPLNNGQLTIKTMPNQEKLSSTMLQSAYSNASINIHPAFQELPGLTYIESISTGINTICSTLTGIKDYLPRHPSKSIRFVEPHSIINISDEVNSLLNSQPKLHLTPNRYSSLKFAKLIIDHISH